MTPRCDTMCCNHGCHQGRGCPERKLGPTTTTSVKAFAPGVIEAHRRPLVSAVQRRELLRWLVLAIGLCVLAVAVGGATGWLAGRA